jgi:AraC family transcriptional regulator
MKDGMRPEHNQTRATPTWDDYRARILRVLTHIQLHLPMIGSNDEVDDRRQGLDLEELAGVACFSSFHFHRVFAAMTGETIADHVRRLRLERAALELRSDARKPVIQVALSAGYEAHEAFTRAFRGAYGVSPAKFRRGTGRIATLAAPSGVHFNPGVPVTSFKTNHIRTKTMKIISKKIEPRRVAYLRHVGPYEEVNQTWVDLVARLRVDQQIRKGSVFIGMGHDNPAVTPAAELRYDACIAVDDDYVPKKPVECQVIAGGDHAVVKNCPGAKIKDAFHFLYGKWLAGSGRELRAAPAFILFNGGRAVIADGGGDQAGGMAAAKKRLAEMRVDIYMPLQPKRARNETLNIEVTTLAPQRVAYVRHVGPYEAAHRVWPDFLARLKAAGLPGKGTRMIGVPLDNPKVTAAAQLRYDACVSVDAKYVPTKPVRVRMIEGGDYAVARNCPCGSIARGYGELLHSWLPKSGRAIRKAPTFLVGVDGTPPGGGVTDIYVPLA